MLVVEMIARIRREYFVKGKPIKEIVRDVKVSGNTVRKVIRSQATAFTYVGGDEKPRLDGDFSDIGHRGAVAAWFAGGSWLGAAVGK